MIMMMMSKELKFIISWRLDHSQIMKHNTCQKKHIYTLFVVDMDILPKSQIFEEGKTETLLN